MRSIIIAVCVAVGCSVVAQTTEEAEAGTTVIDSEKMLGSYCLEPVQRQYFPVCLPSLTARLLQPAGSFPVDFEDFDPEKRKLFQGWITDRGIVKYTVGLYQDFWTDEIVVLDDSGWEMFRIPREKTYDPYDLQREFFDLGKKEVLEDEFTRAVFLPSKISTIADLIPLVFWDAHLEAEQEEWAAQAAALAPMVMAAGSGGAAMMMGGTISLPVDVVPQTNGTVELLIDTAGTSIRHIEIFARQDLVYPPGWALVLNNLNADSVPVSWSDTTTNQMFYYVNDADDDLDGDGYSDLRERLATLTSTNAFDFFDADSDGLQDWFELRFWGSIALYDASDDPDGDGLENGEEMVYAIAPGMTNVVFYSDPSLFDSDFEGLNDFEERRNWKTDAMKPDTDLDGLTDANEVQGSPATDPNNPDTVPPILVLAGN